MRQGQNRRGVVVIDDANWRISAAVVDLAARHRLPTMSFREYVEREASSRTA